MGVSDSVAVPAMETAPPAASNSSPSSNDRPTWLPEKFKDPAQLAEAYAELEKKLGGGPAPKGEPDPAPAPAPEAPGKPAIPSKEEADPLGIFEKEFAETGALSPESYAALAKQGYPKRVVDNYIAGAQARAAQEATKLYEVVGGADKFNEMAAWAGKSMSEAETATLNSMFAEGGAKAQLAARSLMQAYTAANGASPSLIQGESFAGIGEVYRDYAELTKDMSKDDYKFSQAFRDKVAAKLARSNI